jgi:uncharacterized protein (TIGR00251 family)
MKREDASPPARFLNLWVQPRASRNEVVGFQGEFLRIRVTAPPEGGQANRLCCRLLAEKLGIAPSRIEIVGGHNARKKRVRIQDGRDVSWGELEKK